MPRSECISEPRFDFAYAEFLQLYPDYLDTAGIDRLRTTEYRRFFGRPSKQDVKARQLAGDQVAVG